MRRKLLYLSLFLCILTYPFIGPPSLACKPQNDFGVFIGAGPSRIPQMKKYSTVVIDASFYSVEDIKKLKSQGTKVYSYLNLGSIETFRSYYDKFKQYTLDPYDNWPDEYWMDVSRPQWQEHLVFTVAPSLLDKGIDGLFIDNIDVYYKYHTNKTFHGTFNILKSLKNNYDDVPIIINGGYEFVQKCIQWELSLSDVIDGINHESIYSHINFETNTFEKNSLEYINFFKNYFEEISTYDIDVYIIEYTRSKALKKQFEPYYQSKGYHYYISDTINLD